MLRSCASSSGQPRITGVHSCPRCSGWRLLASLSKSSRPATSPSETLLQGGCSIRRRRSRLLSRTQGIRSRRRSPEARRGMARSHGSIASRKARQPASDYPDPMRIEDLFRSLEFHRAGRPRSRNRISAAITLNIPADHPARDMQDTFWLEGRHLLRTHAQPVGCAAWRNSVRRSA